jgi:hypothetical protein
MIARGSQKQRHTHAVRIAAESSYTCCRGIRRLALAEGINRRIDIHRQFESVRPTCFECAQINLRVAASQTKTKSGTDFRAQNSHLLRGGNAEIISMAIMRSAIRGKQTTIEIKPSDAAGGIFVKMFTHSATRACQLLYTRSATWFVSFSGARRAGSTL